MRCPNCGHQNRDVARFCQHCGALLLAQQATPGFEEDAVAGEEQRAGADQAATADAVVPAQATGADQPVDVGLPAATETPGDEARTEGLVRGLSEAGAAGRPEEVEGEAGAAGVFEGEDEALPDEVWADLPVVGAETVPAQPVETEAEADAGVGVEPEEETVMRIEGAGTPGEIEGETQDSGPAHEGASLDEGALGDAGAHEDEGGLTEETSAQPAVEPLDEAEAQERLVSFSLPHGEGASPPEDVLAVEAELRGADVLPWRDESLPVDVLAPGDVIDGRYRVVQLLSVDEEDALYSARDLQRCPQCGFDENSPDQAFCTACGAVMDQKPMVSVLQRPVGREEMPDVELLDHVIEGARAYWVWEEPGTQTDVLGGSEEPMRMVIGQRTHPGQSRELDEDSLFALTMSHTYESDERASGLFIVADGMGGHEAGELASRIGIRTLAGMVLRDVFAREVAGDEMDDAAILEVLERAVQAANEQVFLERERRENDMGTTVTAALLREWTLYLAHVGDCRAYRWGEDGLQQLTTDHSVIASMVASGTAQPDEVYTHPHRSVIYRCVGDQPHVVVDTAVLSIEPGDRLVLCCDGLWEMLREDGIEDVLLREADPQRACDAMVEAANEAGGPDNISVVVVQV